MQRPRRTSEFLDETVGTSTRKSRPTQRLTGFLQSTPSTAQKFFSNRQSRTALSTRNSSFDRGYALQSATRGNTPSGSSSASRALFPSTSTAGAGTLHNDKKWVQEQTQRLTEHLRRAALLGFNNLEFIHQTGLRQMSIKQFVAVVNYFLHFIGGNRLTVGNNHVEDIVSVLQKLHYPHAVNKSWLKTPNTQHSFGYVVVLLNYLLDFVPQVADGADVDWRFPLQEAQEITLIVDVGEAKTFVADSDFQQQMMQHCEAGFELWDKQLMDEYNQMQQQTCNLYIQKRCGFENADALDRELQQLRKQLTLLEQQRPAVPREELKRKRQVEQELKFLLQRKELLCDDLEAFIRQQQQLQTTQQTNSAELQSLEQEVTQLQVQIQQQTCSASQRNTLIEQVDQLNHVMQSLERTLGELQDQNNREQVQLSRLKKKLTDDIEQFNGRMRTLADVVLDAEASKGESAKAIVQSRLQLPLQLQPMELQELKALLNKLRQQIADKLNQQSQQLRQLDRELEHDQQKLCRLINDYELAAAKLVVTENALKQQEGINKKHMDALLQRRQAANVQIEELKVQIVQLADGNAKRRQQLQQLQQENEAIMSAAEQRHKVSDDAREYFLQCLEEQLDENMAELQQLQQICLENEHYLQTFEET